MLTPPASVSGIYLASPHAKYFGVGRIGRDQVDDYAARKGMSTAEVERWLSPANFDAAGQQLTALAAAARS